MAFLQINNVKMKGVSASVPKTIEKNINSTVFDSENAAVKFISATGIESRRITSECITAADLCLTSAEKLIEDLDWDKESIDCLIFVTQTPDYILPSTSCILQSKLGLSENCYTLDISLGCSGWIYALSVICSLMMNGNIKRGLLLSGDTVSKLVSKEDKSTYPLFGDAGTATALEYDKNTSPLFFHFSSDGKGYDAIMIEDGGYRNPFSRNSLERMKIDENIVRSKSDLILNGMDVFSFGISKAPESVEKLLSYGGFDKALVDYYLFHQANFFMNEKIRKKLKLPIEKVPYSLKNFGNTSCATIPLTIVTEIRSDVLSRDLSMIACGFGVGLSWGSVYFEIDEILCPSLIEM